MAVASCTFMMERISAGIRCLNVVALVQHEGHAGVGRQRPRLDDLPHKAKELNGSSCHRHQVVIGVEAAVEVEAAQPTHPQQLGHNELDCCVPGAW